MSVPTYPTKLRLVLKEEYHGYDEAGEKIYDPDGPLGFIHPYEPEKKTWENKCRTQDEWAYGRSRFMKDNELWWERSEGMVVKGKYEVKKTIERVPLNLVPSIIDNVPYEGFKIAGSVKRWSTGNKLWRVRDPRGFQLEISTENFAEIVMSTTIKSGRLEGKYVWNKEGNKTVQLIKI